MGEYTISLLQGETSSKVSGALDNSNQVRDKRKGIYQDDMTLRKPQSSFLTTGMMDEPGLAVVGHGVATFKCWKWGTRKRAEGGLQLTSHRDTQKPVQGFQRLKYHDKRNKSRSCSSTISL